MKIKILRPYMLFFLLFSFLTIHADVWNGTDSDKSWYNSSQTIFQINNSAQLKGLADLVNNDNISFVGCTINLSSDLDLNSHPWIPIGYGNPNFGATEFLGAFNGGNHTISNLTVRTQGLPWNSSPNIGFFGSLSGQLKNLTLNGTLLIDDNSLQGRNTMLYVGGFCGNGQGEIIDCKCNISLTSTFDLASAEFSFISLGAGTAKRLERVSVSGTTSISGTFGCNFGTIACNATEIMQCQTDATINIPLRRYFSTNWQNIGGIAASCISISNAIFEGDFMLYGSLGDGRIGGIVAQASNVTNVIFAPSQCECNVSLENAWMKSIVIGAVCPNVEVENTDNYYIQEGELTDNIATAISRPELESGQPLPNFNPDIWIFTNGKLPMLRAFASAYIIDFPTGNGYVGVEVSEGESLKIILTPEEGWMLDKFYIDGTDLTMDVVDNKYNLTNISSNHVISAVFQKTDDIHTIPSNSDNYRITLTEDGAMISNILRPTYVSVYSLDGKNEQSFRTNSETCEVKLSKGYHLIRVENKTYKVLSR